MTAATFGLWTVLGDAPDRFESQGAKRPHARVRVLRVRCRCGHEAEVTYAELTRPNGSEGCPKCRIGGRKRNVVDPIEVLDFYETGATYNETAAAFRIGRQYVHQLLVRARTWRRQMNRNH